MSLNRQINWAAIGGVVAAISTFLWFVWTVSPDDLKLQITLGFAVLIALLLIAAFTIPRISGLVMRNGRAVRMVLLAIPIPLIDFILFRPLLGESLEVLAVSAAKMVLILLVINLAGEWRTIRPVRSSIPEDEAFAWGGIIYDEVGRGPDRNRPDGAPDALFRLRGMQADMVLSKLILRRLDPVSGRALRQTWRTDHHPSDWTLAVLQEGQKIRRKSSGDLEIPVTAETELLLFASDQWTRSDWFNPGQEYELEVHSKGVQDPQTFSTKIPW